MTKKGELIKEFFIFGPSSLFVLQEIKNFFEKNFEMRNFSQETLKPEEDINNFTPEVVWLTRGQKNPKQIQIQSFITRIQSQTDLPYKLIQWNSIAEYKNYHESLYDEFFWQMGKTAFANYKDASDEVNIYFV